MGRHERTDGTGTPADGTGGANNTAATAPASGLTRRRALGLGLGVAAGVAAAGAVTGSATAAPLLPLLPATPTYPVAAQGTTLKRTLQHGPPNAKGYRHIVPGDGEPTVLRTDLLGGAARGTGSRTALLALAQFTDMHIIDAQSPARVEFLDRLNDPSSPAASQVPFASAYRPQEMLTAHVAEAMVRAVDGLKGAPVTGRPIDFAISTGDNADNTQYNELRWMIDLFDGKQPIRPDSGNLTKWEGVGGPTDYDTAYWHPEGTPTAGKVDNYRGTYGFPTVSHLLDRARAPFQATGLSMPWYTAFGNHDGLVQGNVPSYAVLNAVAVGAVKVTGLPTGVDTTALLARVAAGDATALAQLLTGGPAKVVTPDLNRRLLTRAQTVKEHFNTTGTPVGHGYTPANVAAGTAYYAFDAGPVRCIVLDTCDVNGYDTGSIDGVQYDWLAAELKAHSSRSLDTAGNWVPGTGADRVIAIFSHHTVETMTNPIGADRRTGDKVAALLLQFPNVVVWVNGHTHRNTVTPFARSSAAAVAGGFWEINTASHVDWPQQARVVELVDNGDGTLSIFGTIVDQAAPTSWGLTPASPLELAALSRELGVNDPQRDPETTTVDGKRGAVGDRNVELLVRAPFPIH